MRTALFSYTRLFFITSKLCIFKASSPIAARPQLHVHAALEFPEGIYIIIFIFPASEFFFLDDKIAFTLDKEMSCTYSLEFNSVLCFYASQNIAEDFERTKSTPHGSLFGPKRCIV